MSNEENVPESGSKDQSQPEITDSPSGSESEHPKCSGFLLTVENVKKLQEEYPVNKSILTQQSIEAYINQSNLFLNENENSTDGGKEQSLTEENETTSIVSHGEGTCDDHRENIEEILKKDLQTRSLPSSVHEYQSSKKREVADLETQTEWSYSDRSVESSEQIRKKQDRRSSTIKEKYERIESEGKIIGSMKERGRGEISLDSKEGSYADEEVHVTEKTLFMHEDHSVTDLCHLGCCEFCTTIIRPLPTAEELEERPEKMEKFLCCRTYKEVFQCVIEELIEGSSPESVIDITPHRRLSQTLMESNTKKLLKEVLQERDFEKYREIFEQYMKFGTCTKMTFKLSQYLPKPKIILKKRRPSPKELLKIDLEFKAEHLKVNGTGQLLTSYPSGNVAVLITYVKDSQFTYIILRDSSSHGVQAFFTNQGYAACYHQKETIWVNLDLCNGSYFDEKGIRQKHWNWWDTNYHVHAPPFQPISIQLNDYIQVKIKAQDQLYLTFTNLHQCLKLNVGAKLNLKDPNMLEFLIHPETDGQLINHSKILQIRGLLTNLQKLLKTLYATPAEQTDDLYHIIGELCGQMHHRHRMTNKSVRK
ncbi:hypothetical protein JD844_031789 [Phrynosoma platyrhinos]|uniref:FAM194 C-terminal domain-containing protein n=1 Tax=Phrynosoma platyrhinos TaxID=52577 RepID=A0ABQ7T520_PHRPL|nr:hypothetical protein JD844_031789 [Phrynosoma platyrhinos]